MGRADTIEAVYRLQVIFRFTLFSIVRSYLKGCISTCQLKKVAAVD